MENVTMIASGKGGVGKSTVTALIGFALSQMNKKVLLIDLDAGLPSLEHILLVRENLVYDISDVISGNCTIVKAIYRYKYSSNLYLLPAAREYEVQLTDEVLKKLVGVLSKCYDHILIDCPAGVGKDFLAGMSCASNALLVATPNPISVTNVQKAREYLAESNNIKEIRLIINRFDRKLLTKAKIYNDLDQLIDASGVRLIGIVPEEGKDAMLLSSGKVPFENSGMLRAANRIARRMVGEKVPLPSLRKL